MIILASTTDKVQLVSAQAVQLDVIVSYIDCSSASPPVIDAPDRQLTAITTATTTDILAAPGASKRRNVKEITVRNKDMSTSCVVTIVLDANGADYEAIKMTLYAGETLEYVEGIGFFKIAAENTARVRAMCLTTDHNISSATPTEVPGLSIQTGVGTFAFEYYLITQSGATTTGQKYDVNHDGTVTQFVWNQMWVCAGALASDDLQDQDYIAAAAAVYSAFSSRAKGTAGRGVTTDVDTADADLLVRIEGIMTVTVDGNLELWHGSEAAAQSTVKTGSGLILTRLSV